MFRTGGLHTLSEIILVTLFSALQSLYKNAKGMTSSGLVIFHVVASQQTGGLYKAKSQRVGLYMLENNESISE